MVWKCPKCRYTTTDYTKMQKHMAKNHPSPKKKKEIPKGKQKKRFIYHPPKKKRK